MRTWTSVLIALAAATTLSAYADDKTSTRSETTGTSTTTTTDSSRAGSSTGSDSTMRPSTSGTAAGTGTGTSSTAGPMTGDRHDTSHDAMGSAATSNDPELQNLTNEKFVQKAASSGMKEVQAAELALRNSKSEQVKSFARQMVSDHTKANGQLTALASQNNIQIPKELSSKDKADVEKLRAQTGATFDSAYSQQMKMDHQKAVALFQSCAQRTQLSADIRKYCRETLPTLQEHHQTANNLSSTSSTRSAASDE